MLLTDWSGLLSAADDYEMRPGASEQALTALEEQLQARLPLQLRKLYLVSDGVYDQHGRWFVVWPVAELLRRNEPAWSGDGRQRRELLAFGDDGTGAHFCVPRDGSSGVFLWQPLAAAPCWLANDIGDFWAGWTTGAITTYATDRASSF